MAGGGALVNGGALLAADLAAGDLAAVGLVEGLTVAGGDLVGLAATRAGACFADIFFWAMLRSTPSRLAARHGGRAFRACRTMAGELRHAAATAGSVLLDTVFT